ncbi:MAG: S8 family serine peptidase, partial [Firmicutes bacterium]|nr:S8 family serine peptidase [Bacillota bacterium]
MGRKVIAQILVLALLLGMPMTALGANNLVGIANNTQWLVHFSDYDLNSPEPISVVVELAGAPVIEVEGLETLTESAQEEALIALQDAVLAQMQALGIDHELQHRYTLLLNGIVVNMPANQLALLGQVPQVIDVYPNYETFDALDVSVPAIDLPKAWEPPYGYDGTGVIVGVIDGRIDWKHPAFGGGIGPGYRVIGGWDFVDNRPLAESVNIGHDARHGTHVAATVAAVAPGASIMGYAASSPHHLGGSTLARVLAAMEMAVKDGVRVINLSTGDPYGHEDTIRTKAINRLVDAGVVVVIANGNSGRSGERTTWTYAAAEKAISVGNADTNIRALLTHPATGTKMAGVMLYHSPDIGDLHGGTFEYVDCNYGAEADLYDEEGNSLVEGKIVLVSRGGSPSGFRVKMENAAAAGAIAMIVYNNRAGVFTGTIDTKKDGDIPCIAVYQSEGQFLVDAEDKTITLERGHYFLMNDRSSMGPTPMLNIKPDVSAPGTSIVAAYPYPAPGEDPDANAFLGEDGAWYISLTGTSMATPHVAGVAAILLQANPDWTPEQVKLAIMNTATDIKHSTGESFRPIEQGAGMVNVLRALNPNVFIKPGSLAFKEVTVGETTRSLKLESNADKAITYRIRVEKHDPTHDYEIVVPRILSLAGNSSVDLPVELRVGADLPISDEENNVYCGYIYFENIHDPNDTYRVPYHFVNQMVISQMTVDPIALSFHPDASHKEVTFSFVLSRPVNDLRFRFHGYATTSYFGNTGPLDAGFHTVVWDGTFNDPEFDIPDGVYAVYPQYQLEPGDTYRNMLNTGDQTSPALAYLAIDREAPKICDVAVEVADIANHLRVTGYIDDLSRDVLRDVPVVYLDGEQLETTNRADLSGPGRGYDFTCFDALVPVELDGSTISFTLEAKDRAGNSSVQEIELLPFELDNPAVDLIDSDVHTVSGRAIPGMEVTVGGQVVEVDSEGYFVAEVAVPAAVSFIDVVADVPGWDNFTPFKQQIQ